jgi:serine/threonine protein kinase
LICSEDDNADIKIADFGFAKRITDLSANEVACGTPGYVAPEILRSDPYGKEVDIWSMGVICYVLLVGYPPFYDEDQKKLFSKIKEARYYFHEEYWSAISPEAIDLIRNMLCLDQKKRWTARQLLQHPWIVAQDEVLAQRDLGKSLQELKKYNARRKLRAAADAVIVANRIKRMMGGSSMLDSSDKEEGDIRDPNSERG